MLIGPIVRRELRACLRRADLRRWRNRTIYGATTVAIGFLLLDAFGVPVFRVAGFWMYAFTALLAATLPMSRCLGLIREEREAQTFPLLRLAGISPSEFFLGKALSALWLGAYEILGLVPLVALPFLAGGLAYTTFLDMLASLPAILFASVGLTLFTSAICRDESAAHVVLYSLVLGWCLGVPLVHGVGRMATGVAPFGPEVLWISPLYAASLLEGSASPTARSDLWRSFALLWTAGFAALGAAALWLNRTWRRDEPEATRPTARGRRLTAPDDPDEAILWNPIEDWVARDTSRLRWAYIGLAIAAGLWCLAALAWGRAWMGSLMGLLIMLFVAFSGSSTAGFLLAAKVARERRNGAMEELLGTQITPEQLVDGHVLGVRRLVRPFQYAAAGFAGTVWLAGLFSRSWNPAALVSYLLIGGILLGFLLSQGTQQLYGTFRAAFVSGRAGAAMGRASGFAMANLYNVFNIYRLIRSIVTAGKLPEFPTGGTIETIIVGVVSVGLLLAWAVLRDQSSPARSLAMREMRPLLQEPPLAETDPRWKDWNKSEPISTASN